MGEEYNVLLEKLEGLKELMLEKFQRFEDKLDPLKADISDFKAYKEEHSHTHVALDKRINGLTSAGPKKSQKVLYWILGIVGSTLLIAFLSLIGYGVIHALEHVPTIGNGTEVQKPVGTP